jgi:hypothetical protein
MPIRHSKSTMMTSSSSSSSGWLCYSIYHKHRRTAVLPAQAIGGLISCLRVS